MDILVIKSQSFLFIIHFCNAGSKVQVTFHRSRVQVIAPSINYQTTQIPLDLIEHFVKRLGLGDSFNAFHLSLLSWWPVLWPVKSVLYFRPAVSVKWTAILSTKGAVGIHLIQVSPYVLKPINNFYWGEITVAILLYVKCYVIQPQNNSFKKNVAIKNLDTLFFPGQQC